MTKSTCILDLVLSSQPQLISGVLVIPGMLDYEGMTFQLILLVNRLPGNLYKQKHLWCKKRRGQSEAAVI